LLDLELLSTYGGFLAFIPLAVVVIAAAGVVGAQELGILAKILRVEHARQEKSL
jgi:hypothetical protein